MATYIFNSAGNIEIDFYGVIPSEEVRNKMKSVKYRWDPNRKIWWAEKHQKTLLVAREICGEEVKKKSKQLPMKDFCLKLKIKDIVNASQIQLEVWQEELKEYVNEIMSENSMRNYQSSVSEGQEAAWMDCFKFISKTLKDLNFVDQEYSLVFEYSLPGAVHERPDVFLLTQNKVISLEFKRKAAPQNDDNKDDIAQAIRYKEWLEIITK